MYFEDITPERRAELRQTVLESLHRGQATQVLRVGDTLEVVYHVRPRPQPERYRLGVGDRVAVTFGDGNEMDFAAGVQPDGWIALPDTKDVKVAGMTVDEVNRLVSRRYADLLVDPRVKVRLEEWTSEEDRLAAEVENLSTGRSKRVPVLRDGTIVLPLVKPIMAEGASIPEIRERIQAVYDDLGLDLQISALLADSPGDRVFVFGAVELPGVFTPARPITALMAVAQAGGPSIDGSLSDIRVLYADEEGTPHLRKVNLHNVLSNLALEEDLVLPDNAVVYVPPTVLAQTGRFMDVVLNQIFFYRGFALAGSYEFNGNN